MVGLFVERCPQPRATRGSQRWLQYYVNEEPKALECTLGLGPLRWLSPLAEDEFAEYRDGGFLERLGISLNRVPLNSFWPPGGPCWDGLARTGDGRCVVVEAKAHVPEMFSPPCAASGKSLEQIRKALAETKAAFGVTGGQDWCEVHYQYANRLAHAYLLNELNRVPVYLVFLYFIGDTDMNGPDCWRDWETAIAGVHEAMGIVEAMPTYVRDALVDVRTAVKG
jgi:hypothetical protein